MAPPLRPGEEIASGAGSRPRAKTTSTHTALRTIAALCAALCGCHERAAALSVPAADSLAQGASEGAFGRKQVATLSETNHGVAAFRYQLPAPGALISTAQGTGIAVAVFAEGGNEPLARGEAGGKLEATDLPAGTYYVAVSSKDAQASRVELRTLYRPDDPDGAQEVCGTRASARRLAPGHAQVDGAVDYSARRRTCWWKVPLLAEGALSIRFQGGHGLSAEFVPGHGAAEKIDPSSGFSRADLPAGDYFVKVYANDPGDAGRYRLSTTFAIRDTCENGGPACSLEGAEELSLPSDSRTAGVDYSRGRQFHFYKATFKEKGRLTITFKLLRARRGSKVEAYFMRSQDDEGDRIAGNMTREIEGPGDVYIRVQAKDAGDRSSYAIATLFQPLSPTRAQ